MNSKEILSKLKPLIIIILLFSVVFFLRAEAYNISGAPNDTQSFYKDSSGLPYFSEMDSYYNYRLTLNYIEKGMMGDTKINGTDWDLHSYFPPGRAVDYPPLIVYVTTLFYYIANLVGDVPLMNVAFWTGAIIGSLCVIPAYLLVRKITNDYGGIAAAILVATAPTYFAHTYAGFFDTDMFNVLLPLLVIWFFVLSIQANNIKSRVTFAFLSVLSLGVFSLAWVGYIFYLVMLVIFVIAYLLIAKYVVKLDVLKSPKTYPNLLQWFIDQKEIFSLSIILILGIIFVGLFNGFSSIGSSISGLFGATQLQELVQSTAYPNVYISVSELQIPSLISTTNGISSVMLPGQSSVVGGVGGLIAFLAGIGGIALLLWKINSMSNQNSEKRSKKLPKSERKKIGKTKAKEKKSQVSTEKTETIMDKAKMLQIKKDYLLYVVLFSVWLLLTGYAVTKGFRFVSTFSVPICLSAGIFVGFAVVYIKENLKTGSTLALLAFITAALAIYPFGISTIITLGIGILAAALIVLVKKPKIQTYAVMVLVVLAVIAPSVAAANSLANSVVPGTDDAMYNSMQWVKANTTNETVVISWWDFGHFFTASADRPVTFDGGSQNTPRAYWVGKAMLTSNESLSAGIFRMLASSGDQAYLTLDNYTNNSGKTAEILNQTLGLSKDNAKSVMTTKYNLTSQQADTILNYTHPSNPRPYVFVASSDLLGKAGWWSYFGNWDFEKGNSTGYNYYPAIASSKPQNVNGSNISQTVNTMVGDQIVGVIINESSNGTNGTNATIVIGEANGTSYQSIEPHKLFIVNGNQIVKNEIVDSNGTLSLIAIGESGQYTTILMDRQLEDAMFTKLFLMGGFNQTTFQPANQEQGVLLWTPITNTTSSSSTS